jgi:membrane associated rhomboid family serine protease
MLVIVPLGTKGSNGFPIFTLLICMACAIVYLFANTERDILALAYHPGTFDVPRMFSSVFAHGDIWHLIGNLFFFYSFARTVETRISVSGYLLAFLIFVFATNLAFSLKATEDIPTVGLSGVVWGYMGIFAFRFPKEYIACFVWYLIFFWRTIEVPALLFILAFLAFDVASYRHLENSSVNYIAHFSGFAAGALFRLVLWNTFSTDRPEPGRRNKAAPRPLASGGTRRR